MYTRTLRQMRILTMPLAFRGRSLVIAVDSFSCREYEKQLAVREDVGAHTGFDERGRAGFLDHAGPVDLGSRGKIVAPPNCGRHETVAAEVDLAARLLRIGTGFGGHAERRRRAVTGGGDA